MDDLDYAACVTDVVDGISVGSITRLRDAAYDAESLRCAEPRVRPCSD